MIADFFELYFFITPQGLHSKFVHFVSGKMCAVELDNLNIYHLLSIIVIVSFLSCQSKYIIMGSKWTISKHLSAITKSEMS